MESQQHQTSNADVSAAWGVPSRTQFESSGRSRQLPRPPGRDQSSRPSPMDVVPWWLTADSTKLSAHSIIFPIKNWLFWACKQSWYSPVGKWFEGVLNVKTWQNMYHVMLHPITIVGFPQGTWEQWHDKPALGLATAAKGMILFLRGWIQSQGSNWVLLPFEDLIMVKTKTFNLATIGWEIPIGLFVWRNPPLPCSMVVIYRINRRCKQMQVPWWAWKVPHGLTFENLWWGGEKTIQLVS